MKRAVDLSHPRTRAGAPALVVIGHAAVEGRSLPGQTLSHWLQLKRTVPLKAPSLLLWSDK